MSFKRSKSLATLVARRGRLSWCRGPLEPLQCCPGALSTDIYTAFNRYTRLKHAFYTLWLKKWRARNRHLGFYKCVCCSLQFYKMLARGLFFLNRFSKLLSSTESYFRKVIDTQVDVQNCNAQSHVTYIAIENKP